MNPRAKSFPGCSIRRTWRISPVTRVHDNDIRKQRKKERQTLKKRLAEEMKDSRQPFCLFSYDNLAATPRFFAAAPCGKT